MSEMTEEQKAEFYRDLNKAQENKTQRGPIWNTFWGVFWALWAFSITGGIAYSIISAATQTR